MTDDACPRCGGDHDEPLCDDEAAAATAMQMRTQALSPDTAEPGGGVGRNEVIELRAYVRAVDRWIAESDAKRNEGGNPYVRKIAALDSAERVVVISRHMLGQHFPHLHPPAAPPPSDRGEGQ